MIAGDLTRRVALTTGGWLLAGSLLACHHAPPPRTSRHTTAVAPSSPAVRRLQHDIDALLAAPELERGYWGVLVESLETGETLYARNARRLMMPASNMKIVTLAAAAQRLGWNYTYETRLVACGAIEGGSLGGDLVAVGSGDPTLTLKNAAAVFDQWADALKAAGVRRVTGRLVGDDNAFDHEALGMGWSWDDLQDGYAAGVSALQFNENAARVTIAPGAEVGDPAVIGIDPEASGLAIRNQIVTSAAGEPAAIRTRRLPGSSTLELAGALPMASPPRTEAVSVESPTRFFVQTLRAALVGRGIEVAGPAVAIGEIEDSTDLPRIDHGTVVLSYRSPPLSTIAATMMKVSQNLYAETLLKTLGAVEGTATIEMGRRAVDEVLKTWGIPDGGVIERDGSGLSRYNYVTPESLVAILTRVDHDAALREPFEAALPIAGRDGTLANRMKGTLAEGRVRAKTGSMANVRALSGYLTTAGGEPVVFSILANNFEGPADAVNKATDAIVIALAAFKR